ncbi:MAG: phospholipid scramblase-related protein [Mycobacteriales bacterium]
MTTPQAGWYADPTGSFEHRWWDGARWTEQVAHGGQQTVSPLPDGQAPVQASRPDQVQRQVTQQAGLATGAPGNGTVFTEPVLVVNQKVKLVELTNQYSVYDQHGGQLASVTEVGQSTLKKLVRLVSEYDQFLTHRLEVRDMTGRPQLLVTRPAKLLKSKVIVEKPGVGEVGRLVQQNAIGKIRFALMAGTEQVGEMRAENWRAWDFAIVDSVGTEIARIKKTFEGLAKTLFTTADNYVVHLHRPLADPLLSLVVASALTVDTALKQDSRGFN